MPTVDASQDRAGAFRNGRDQFVFFTEWSGPYPGVTEKNAPPRFTHIVVHASDLEGSLPFEWPKEVRDVPNPIPKKRHAAILSDETTWFGRTGQLVLAPSFPTGGIDGDHIIFRWQEGELAYAISIHGWAPLGESIKTLKEIVGSIDEG
jgi:hypothetical protein